MTRGPCTFRQQDVTRALKATVAAGIEVQRVEIGRDGKIMIVTTKADPVPPGDCDEPNGWDKVLHEKTS
jgi:hypothetical protein